MNQAINCVKPESSWPILSLIVLSLVAILALLALAIYCCPPPPLKHPSILQPLPENACGRTCPIKPKFDSGQWNVGNKL